MLALTYKMDKHLNKRIPANDGKHFLCQFF